MDVDLDLQIPRPTRDVDGNAIWRPLGARQQAPAPSGPRSQSPIRLRDVLFVIVGGTIGGFVTGIVASLIASAFTHSRLIALSALGFPLYLWYVFAYRSIACDQDWPGLQERFAPVGAKPLILAVSTAVAIIAWTMSLVALLKWAGVDFVDLPDTLQLNSWSQLPLATLLLVLVAPFSEELVFRGLLLDWLRQKMNVWAAAVILSVGFSMLHNNAFSTGASGWLSFIERFLLGMGASALTIKYRSLKPAFAMHATWNAIVTFSALLDL